MTRSLRHKLIGTIVILLMICAASAQASNGVRAVTDYIDLLRSGNFESAKYMWTISAQSRSERFGIEYEGIPLKIDCSSPLIRLEPVRLQNSPRPIRQVTNLPVPGYYMHSFQSILGNSKYEHKYLAYDDGEYWWLELLQDYYARDWEVLEGRYLRIHVHPSVRKFVGKASMEQVDAFIEETAELLDFKKEDLEMIEREKIEYFYCDTDKRVEMLTGFLIKGTLDLPSGDIISSYFPHFHEMSHLLVAIKLQRQPLYTLPIMREGLAVFLGGRWGKAPTALMDLGGFLLQEEIVWIDSLLTMTGFEQHAGSDIAYPVGGLWIEFLADEIGIKRCLELYRDLSGPFDSVYAMSIPSIHAAFVSATKAKSWDELNQKFEKHIQNRIQAKAVILPGKGGRSRPMLQTNKVTVSGDSDWLTLEYTGLKGEEPIGNLLFGRDESLAAGASLMFEDQYGSEADFVGYRFGIRFDRNEAGLYDYASNCLVAKYIWGITPSESYFDEEANKITFRIKKDLVGNHLPTADNSVLLAE